MEPGERLIDSRDRQVGLRLPLAVDQRIDALIRRATDAGERTNRRELIAAILADSDLTGEQLGTLLRSFRTAKVRDVLLDVDAASDVLHLVSHKPGPRVAR